MRSAATISLLPVASSLFLAAGQDSSAKLQKPLLVETGTCIATNKCAALARTMKLSSIFATKKRQRQRREGENRNRGFAREEGGGGPSVFWAIRSICVDILKSSYDRTRVRENNYNTTTKKASSPHPELLLLQSCL